MKRTFPPAAFLLLLCCAPLGQASAAPSAPQPRLPTFDAADVHVSPHRNSLYLRGGALYGERFSMRDATLVDLIANAYSVEPESVLGGPAWLQLDYFDVFAKAPVSTPPDQVRLMLRSLLTDRFKLVAHTSIVPQHAYVLTAGPSPNLQRSDGSGEPGCQFQPPPKPPTGTPMVVTGIAFACHNMTMDAFAQFLREQLPRPVVNSTGLRGAWDFELHWEFRAPSPGVDPVQDALDKQVGLKLELKTTPLPGLVVDSVNEQPTPNAPDLTRVLPPLPAQTFEVATIKPWAAGDRKRFAANVNADILTFNHASPMMLIFWAWDFDPELIANQPPWLNQEFFQVTAKAPAESAPNPPGRGSTLDVDDFKEMLRALLADRFKLTAHVENRPGDAYTLIVASPKMKKADPSVRASCELQEVTDPDHPTPLTRQVTCRNITMAQFATQLFNLEGEWGGYIKSPVLDATGLTGGYDFVLKYNSSGSLRPSATPVAASSDLTDASEPTGAVSLFDAINKQLGLKLEKQRRPVPTLVIDHIEQPSPN